MRLSVVLAILMVIFVLACSSASPSPDEPTPSIHTTGEPTGNGKPSAAQSTGKVHQTNAPLPTATSVPLPMPTATQAPTATPDPTFTSTPTPATTPTATPTPTPVYSAETVPLIDAHSHVDKGIPTQEVITRMLDNGVVGVMLFGGFNNLRNLQRENPDFVFPFSTIRRNSSTKELVLNDATLSSLVRELKTGVMRGIGEISLRHRRFSNSPTGGDQNPADGPVVLQIYDLAARYDVPVNVHVDHEFSDELERALEHNRNTNIIWGHMGDGPASLIRGMMGRHPNLYADISTRNPIYDRGIPIDEQSLTHGDGTIKEEWRTLFEEFPDRFLFGIDVGHQDRHDMIGEVVAYYRSVFGQLTQATAEAIANGNAKRFLGLP